MKPVSVSMKKGEYIITHRCEICKFEKNNKAAKEDNFEELLKLNALNE